LRQVRRRARKVAEENRRMNRKDKRALRETRLDLKNPDMQLLLNNLPPAFVEWLARNREELFAKQPKRFLRRLLVPIFIGPTDEPRGNRLRRKTKAEDEDTVYVWDISEDKKIWTLVPKEKSEEIVTVSTQGTDTSLIDASTQKSRFGAEFPLDNLS